MSNFNVSEKIIIGIRIAYAERQGITMKNPPATIVLVSALSSLGIFACVEAASPTPNPTNGFAGKGDGDERDRCGDACAVEL